MGFVWQFITLAGFHCDSLGIDLFAKDYSERGMLAYVEGIQRMERKHKVRAWGAAWYRFVIVRLAILLLCHWIGR
jgi:isocitrate lyase